MPRTIFPAPDHDHARCSSDAIAHAEALCAERAQRLTPIRRQVLEALAASHEPLGAYEIMDRLAASGPRPAPITVYRALDFLLEQRPRPPHREPQRLHRLHPQSRQTGCQRSVPDLRALRRGRRGAPDGGPRDAAGGRRRSAGFAPKTPVIEITGICSHCPAAA